MTRQRAARSPAAFLVALALLGLASCSTVEPPATRTVAPLDPCAERLHDICGRFLLHYAAHQTLPAALDALDAAGETGATPADKLFVCPVTGLRYTYRPEGIPMPGQRGRLMLYDSAPHPDGERLGIVVGPQRPKEPLAAGVTRVPESVLLNPPPQSTPPVAAPAP